MEKSLIEVKRIAKDIEDIVIQWATDIAKAANAVASITLAVNETNNPDLSRESALKKIKSADIEVIRLK